MTDLKNKLIKYDTAILARFAGFDELCRFVYNNDLSSVELEYYHGAEHNGKVRNSDLQFINGEALATRPTQTLLQDWLRVLGVHVEVNLSIVTGKYQVGMVVRNKSEVMPFYDRISTIGHGGFDYHDTLEQGLHLGIKQFIYDQGIISKS